jgi:hypothetical protein
MQRDKVMACQVACTNPDVGEDWHLFHAVVAPFNNRRADFEWLEMPHVPELARTCQVLQALAPGLDLSPEVTQYIAMCCWDAGLVYFPWSRPAIVLPRRGSLKGLIDPDLIQLADAVAEALAAGKPADDEPDPANLLATQLSKINIANRYVAGLAAAAKEAQ